jgi:Whirly transcription factor
MIRPMKYAIYKGVGGKFGAVQFSLMKPNVFCFSCKEKYYDTLFICNKCGGSSEVLEKREGAVFVEVAPTVGPNLYDWDKKIIFALSVVDIGKLVNKLRAGQEVKLLHDPGAQTEKAGQVTKTLSFTAPTEKGSLFSIQEKNKSGEPKSYNVPLSPEEMTIIGTLLVAAIPVCLAWN